MTVAASSSGQLKTINHIFRWLPVIVGLLVLYIPTIKYLATNLWGTEEQAHGPIILTVFFYLFWQKRSVFSDKVDSSKPIVGSVLLIFGLLLFAVGRSQEILFLEIGSLIPVLTGISLITMGLNSFKQVWFAILFTVFLIPLPSPVVDLLTGPLKESISLIAENILYYFGYPIGRSGVTLSIGSTQLLVANACSGLHSMFSLSALGFLYLYSMQYKNWPRNFIIIASLLPIAFFANLIRVITLVLVTYYFGYEVGQGFVHKFAGIFSFAISLLFIYLFDSVLGQLQLFKTNRA